MEGPEWRVPSKGGLGLISLCMTVFFPLQDVGSSCSGMGPGKSASFRWVRGGGAGWWRNFVRQKDFKSFVLDFRILGKQTIDPTPFEIKGTSFEPIVAKLRGHPRLDSRS